MENKEILSVENLTKRYQKFFLNNVCMKILPGEIVGIIGPNGAGKSTTLKIILGIIDADSGTIVMKDEKINKDNHKKIKGKIGYVGEDPSFFEKSRLKVHMAHPNGRLCGAKRPKCEAERSSPL